MRLPPVIIATYALSELLVSAAQGRGECKPCDDKSTPIMSSKGKVCGDFPNIIASKCNEADNWRQNGFCRYTCFKKGRGYENDNCCQFSGGTETTPEVAEAIRWYFNTPQGETTLDMLQCQALTFDWNKYGDGSFHSVWEFEDEEAYASCDRSRAEPIQTSRNAGLVRISGPDTLVVTKRWFGSLDDNDCEEGRMKAALKIRPNLQKFEGLECRSGKVDISKKEASVEECRDRCERRRGCVAIQYNAGTTDCTIYSQVPIAVATSKSGVSCEIAVTSCDKMMEYELPQPFSCSKGFDGQVQVGAVKNPPMDEASGIVTGYKNTKTLYTHNDYGGTRKPEIFAIATSDHGQWNAGEIQRVFALQNPKRDQLSGKPFAAFKDYEDIAIGPGPNGGGYIYVGDIGDNGNERDEIVIYRVPEPDVILGSYRSTVNGVTELVLKYPSGRGINAECMMYDPFDDRIYIVTKSKGEIFRTPTFWRYGSNASMELKKVGKVSTMQSPIVGCDISKNGQEILIKEYGRIYYYCRDEGKSLTDVLAGSRGEKQPYRKEPQGEAVCFANDRNGGYYTLSESKGRSRTPLYYYERK